MSAFVPRHTPSLAFTRRVAMRHTWAAAGLALGLAVSWLPAHAQGTQKLLPEQSSVGFTFKQMGVPVDGRFKQFEVQSQFDAAKPEQSRVALTIALASATIGDAATDAELPKATWFNTAKFPQATFQSTGVKALGGGKFEISGKLSIKGQTDSITVPVQLTQSGAVTAAVGQFTLKRLTFRIGDNEWADTSIVANDVTVKFKLAIQGIGKL